MIKCLGIMLVSASIISYSFSLSNNLRDKIKNLKEIIGLIECIKNNLIIYKYDTKELIIKSCEKYINNDNSFIILLIKEIKEKKDYISWIRKNIEEDNLIDSLEIKNELTDIINVLGKENIDFQDKVINEALQEMKNKKTILEKEYAEKNILYKKLGLIGGLGFFILMI